MGRNQYVFNHFTTTETVIYLDVKVFPNGVCSRRTEFVYTRGGGERDSLWLSELRGCQQSWWPGFNSGWGPNSFQSNTDFYYHLPIILM